MRTAAAFSTAALAVCGLSTAAGLSGCASSRAAETGGTGRTAEMRLRVPNDYGRASVGTGVSIVAVGESVCLTTDCTVKGVRLTFSNTSRQQVQMRVVPVVMTAGDKSFAVPTAELPRDLNFMPGGPFLTTLVRSDFIDALAEEEDVKVTFGATTFTFSREARTPLRRLLTQMRATESAPASPPPGR